MTRQRTGTLSEDDLAMLLDLLLEASPAMVVRIVLREHARRGTAFEQAWLNAMQSIPRSGDEAALWRQQLHRHKPEWRAAYGTLITPHADAA